jgi:very-short-patch-repair endonuclease
MTNTNNSKLAFDSLEIMRKRLLDLTLRNKLINYRHTKKQSLRIIDELPNQLAETLLSGSEMTFLAIEEPTKQELIDEGFLEGDSSSSKQLKVVTNAKKQSNYPDAREWAKIKGFNANYKVPEDYSESLENKHTDKNIQTLLYSHELEAVLKKIFQISNSSIAETGTNILFLSFGFLEWKEGGKDSVLAPLFLLPVNIKKGRLNKEKRVYEYTIQFSDESVIPNLSLKEKLRNDFGMELPDLNEETKPEDYFKEIVELIESKQEWRVRRYITLSLLNFSKLIMYLDLDPSNWPSAEGLIDHPIVSRFLGGGSDSDASSESEHFDFGEEHKIDEIDEIHDKYPLVYDADSSQHSAIIDVINGDNLVIEGPPGTGKSQTITNLIAAALFQQKKVLFVAEKQAALNVVYDKLNEVDLGIFCLNMHSHRSQKRKILDDIKLRRDKHGTFSGPDELNSQINGYEYSKEKLSNHAELINKKWKDTGKTIHEVLMAAVLYREYLDVNYTYDESSYIKGLNQKAIERNEDHIDIFQKVYQSVIKVENKTIHDHPWYGVTNHRIQAYQGDSILDLLNEWQASLLKLIDLTEKLENKFSLRYSKYTYNPLHEEPSVLLDLENISKSSKGLELDYNSLPSLTGQDLKHIKSCFDLYNEILFGYKRMEKTIDIKVIRSLLNSNKFIEIENHISNYADPDTSLLELFNSLEKLKSLKAIVSDINKPLNKIRDAVGQESSKYFYQSKSGFIELRKIIDIVSTLKLPYLKYRDNLFDNNELDSLLPEIKGELEILLSQSQSLEGIFDIEKLTDGKKLASLNQILQDESPLRWFKQSWWSARRAALGLVNIEGTKFSSVKPFLGEAIEFSNNLLAFNHKTKTQYSDVLGDYVSGLDTNISAIEEMRNWYRKVRDEYGIGFGDRVDLGNSILKFSDGLIQEIHQLASAKAVFQIDEAITNLKNLEPIFSPYEEFSISDAILIGNKGVVDTILDVLGGALLECNPLINSNGMLTSELLEKINVLNSLNINISSWNKLEKEGNKPLLMEGFSPEVDLSSNHTKLDVVRNTLELAETLDSRIIHDEISQYIYKHHNLDDFNELEQYKNDLNTSLNDNKAKFDSFQELAMIKIDDWMKGVSADLFSVVDRNKTAISDPDSLDKWLDYLRHKEQMLSLGFGLEVFVAMVEGIGDLSTDMIKIYRAIIFDLMARDILSNNSDLSTFSGISQLTIQEKFIKYDAHIKKLQCQKIAWRADQVSIPPGRSSGKVSSFTEGFLINHEIRKKARHIPIRQLIKRSGNALVSLKPCFMMGPMSVAQYLKPGGIKFDLVIMDEASQIKPQDALGAIARGGQAVIVGDPKQLPPTSFFDRNVDSNDEENQVAIEQQESILDVAAPLFSAKQLRWHYRSRHESLIAFSNQSFYESNLVVFPSPNSDSKEFGVHLSKIHNGCFVNNRNKEEAKIIALAVKEHLVHSAHESIGVVAMNTNQRDQIEREVEILAKEDKSNVFSRILDKNLNKSHEPLFFKNLENVQGDERDVIFISMTYGPNEPGQRVPQRFGPINQSVGWRRLNVLFTRSKKRMQVFSSMDSGDVIADIESTRGIKALHDFLQYCETGSLRMTATDTGSAPDNDFELSIMNLLRDSGYECRPQIGVAGYFIDLGVIDPGKPGRYLMGVECDGATYHSAKSARDRDILRQQVLEGLGWRIRRIWSTDWFKNPHTTLKPILDELALLKTPGVYEEDDTQIEEVDEIETIIEEVELHDSLDPEYHNPDLDLRKILLKFDSDIIREKYPDTPYSRQLLGPAMLEALIAYTPCDKTEFLEFIPLYLRENLNPDEAGDFLERVLDVINFNTG